MVVSGEFLVVARLVLLALIYLTFLCVASALWAGMRATQPATPPAEPLPGGPAEPWDRPALVELAGSEAGRRILLAPETSIGRGARCQLRLEDPLVSTLHARICMQAGGWWVEDLGSTNGTLLNGVAVRGLVALAHGDRLQIGEAMLEVVLQTRSGSQTAAT